jgi:hypothetical protein
MADHAPFHQQLNEHLRRRYWTTKDLFSAMHSMNGRSAGVFAAFPPGNHLDELQAILQGYLAPTEPLGELIADVVIGLPDGLDEEQQREREALVGSAYVAECHGRRQQPPYTHGVIGDSRRSNSAVTVDQTEVRQAKVQEQRRQRLLARLIEIEERQLRQRSRVMTDDRQGGTDPFANWRGNGHRHSTSVSDLMEQISSSSRQWSEAAEQALAHIPPVARRADPSQAQSFLHVLGHSFKTGKRFPEFLELLLQTWRSESCSRRGRRATRLSPEQLGAWIGELNSQRAAENLERQAWFDRHKGPALTGSSLRNYLAGTSERPQRECIQKMVWALVPDGPSQLAAEQRLWRISRASYVIEPSRTDRLLELLDSDWDLPLIRREVGSEFPLARVRLGEARVIKVQLGTDPVPFQGLADGQGLLLTPLIHPQTRCIAADIAAIDPENGTLLTPIDLALASEDRGALMRALLDFSGMPITRIAELTRIHETLFQQWMREGRNRRIEDRHRAKRIVNLLNPPELARWPTDPEQVRKQNERAIRLLTTNVASLADALRKTRECTIPAEYQLDEEKEKTYRAAFLLRQVFGKDSLSNLTGAEVGRLLAVQQLGDAQSFKHLREGIRARGRKSARRATLEQAYFLAATLERTVGPVDGQLRKEFVEQVACVDLADRGQLLSPQELLKRVEDATNSYTVRDLTREMMRRSGGLVRFSRKLRISQQTLRAFISKEEHFLHHPVARRLAEHGMGFSPTSEEFRRFVVLTTAAWRRGIQLEHLRLSSIFREYSKRLPQSKSPIAQRTLRARLLGRLLAQAALSPRELADALQVTPAVLAGWTTARSGRFTSAEALERFVQLMQFEEEQVEFIREAFGPTGDVLVS